MSTVARIKHQLIERQTSYVPLGETAEHIRDISIGLIIGATCVGKSTIIKTITDIDKEFSNPGGFTTRQLRPSDAKTYRHLENSAASLEGFLERVKNGEPVQYNVYDTGHIYGSEVQDYPTPFSVLDTQYSAVVNLERAGFKNVQPVALVTEPAQYERQIKTRFGGAANGEERLIRLKEGQKSLEYCLEQGEDISWVVNRIGEAQAAAYEVIGLVRGYRRQSTTAQIVGERLLKRVNELIA